LHMHVGQIKNKWYCNQIQTLHEQYVVLPPIGNNYRTLSINFVLS
jgi:hypothetical protein